MFYQHIYMYTIKKIVQECATTCAYLEQRNQITETNQVACNKKQVGLIKTKSKIVAKIKFEKSL